MKRKTNFYFTEYFIERDLYILLDKMSESLSKILLLCSDIQKATEIDNKLWTFSQSHFIPHEIFSIEKKIDSPIMISYFDNIKNIDLKMFDTVVIYNIDWNFILKVIDDNPNIKDMNHVFFLNKIEINQIKKNNPFISTSENECKEINYFLKNSEIWNKTLAI